jgi:hypothetical protein
MTTSVKIDAHAGWPVQVVFENGEPHYPKSISVETVAPNTERTFYIHSGMRILSVIEQPQQKAQAT